MLLVNFFMLCYTLYLLWEGASQKLSTSDYFSVYTLFIAKAIVFCYNIFIGIYYLPNIVFFALSGMLFYYSLQFDKIGSTTFRMFVYVVGFAANIVYLISLSG